MKINLPKIHGYNMDAGLQAFTEKQLEYVRKKVYRKKYRKLKAREAFPVSYEIPGHAKSHEYNIYDHFGLMALIESYADSLPIAGVAVDTITAKIRGYGLAYVYSIDDLEAARANGVPLNTEQATACRRGWEELVNSVAWKGDTDAGLVGFLYIPNITSAQAPTGNWLTASAEEMYLDMVSVKTTVFNATNGEEMIDRLYIAQNRWEKVENKIYYDNKTVLTVFKENNPTIKVDYLTDLNQVEPRPSGLGGASNCMVGYVYDEDYVTLEIPREFKQEPPQPENLAYKVNTHGKTGGLTFRYPLSGVIVEGI